MKYKVVTQELFRKLKTNNFFLLKWYVHATLAVHSDFKSPSGSTITMGKGVITYMPQKQKLNTKSSI